MALVDCCERMPYKQRISTLAPLLSELLRAFDPSQEVRLMESLCESTFHGLRLIQHLLLLAAATKLAYLRSSNPTLVNIQRADASENNVHERARVADDLLQAFCELSKSHAEKEPELLRRYWVIVVTFQPPFALQVLINCLTELLYEVQNMRIGPFLDDLPSDHYKSNTVYAVAQPTANKKQPTSGSETESTVKRKKPEVKALELPKPRTEHVDAENELFGTIGVPLDPLATARQISGTNMRRNAEKRLVNKENGTNVSVPEDSKDGSGKNGKKKRGVKRR
ncbi:hypothetical protein TELCIR_05713 [Teladorsagia circumcincta]|uniref:Uncharacterized protein n=1 Tax=Teladorsagia circumcincta TaxID=45464 RepID=A0A2G9UQ85_TELCI|nr:hypothetical protein TELCIR_05713 [Teladorsagia circumcincta]